MDIEQLNIFIRVATLKNFTRAAESLFLSQPTISARIKALEEEMGVILFDRSRSRELSLTEAGIIFWDYAQEMINLYAQSIEKMRQQKNNVTGLLRIGASSVPGAYILPSILHNFKEEYGQVKTSVFVKDTAEIISDILDYALDIGMVGFSEDDSRLEYINIAEDELCLITPCGLLSEKGYPPNSTIPLADLFDLDFIMREPGSATRKVLEAELNKQGYSLRDFDKVIFMDSLEAIKQSVRQGLGSSVVSRCSVEDYLKSRLVDEYYPASLDLKRYYFLVYHRNRVLSNAANSFLHFICKKKEQDKLKV